MQYVGRVRLARELIEARIADYVAPYTVFDIGGNRFRIITAIHYSGAGYTSDTSSHVSSTIAGRRRSEASSGRTSERLRNDGKCKIRCRTACTGVAGA
ncbi:MAG: type II toxin-antitoxin system HigB family toxin [Rhodanobacteraceae bacterium]